MQVFYFNPRSLAGATRFLKISMMFKLFQSTLPRGSDREFSYITRKPTISIHAPSRERPCRNVSQGEYIAISIHAPSRERQFSTRRTWYRSVFQSTLPRGSDQSRDNMAYAFTDFNPRSLAGATICKSFKIAHPFYFNPRSLAGATVSERRDSLRQRKFQSTLPRGSDRRFVAVRTVKANFNPRALAGATYQLDIYRQNLEFQSTLPRGSDI